MEHINPTTVRDVMVILAAVSIVITSVLSTIARYRRQRRAVYFEDQMASRAQLEDVVERFSQDIQQVRENLRSLDNRIHALERDIGEMPSRIIALLRNAGVLK